jgi:hypothetical protein
MMRIQRGRAIRRTPNTSSEPNSSLCMVQSGGSKNEYDLRKIPTVASLKAAENDAGTCKRFPHQYEPESIAASPLKYSPRASRTVEAMIPARHGSIRRG